MHSGAGSGGDALSVRPPSQAANTPTPLHAQACQLRLCNALADFYKTTNNLTDPWDNEFGWELTATMPCQRLVDGSPRQAVYCSWYGVECCTPQGMADRRCAAVNTVTALELTINNLNASVEDPALLRSLKSLHDCGMRVLNLEANNLIGALPDAWGSLNQLLVFNLGEWPGQGLTSAMPCVGGSDSSGHGGRQHSCVWAARHGRHRAAAAVDQGRRVYRHTPLAWAACDAESAPLCVSLCVMCLFVGGVQATAGCMARCRMACAACAT